MRNYWRSLMFWVFGVILTPCYAANWLTLQGTESPSTSDRAKIWGFIQAQYQKDFSNANAANQYVPFKLIGPNLTSQSMFNVNRARIGVRGTGLPIDSKVNYFILGEFGNNGLTAGGSRSKLTDASITLNHVPFARVRVGLFKYPGSEEGLQAIQAFDYINFTTVTNQLMQERFPNNDNYYKTLTGGGMRANTEARYLGDAPNGFEKPVGGFRDVGVQVFDWFNTGAWEHTYAVMLGNGNGTNFGDNNGDKTLYGYWASEWLTEEGGQGARRDGLKLFVWFQTGQRAYDQDFTYARVPLTDPLTGAESATDFAYVSSGRKDIVHYKRTRSGIGVKYLNRQYRIVAEYLTGEGMIFLGPHKESFDMNDPGGNGNGLTGKANGWYIDAGWQVFDTRYEVDFRYDVYNRLTGDVLEVNYSTITLGGQYAFNAKTRFALNYEIRNAKSATGNPSLEDNFNGIGARLSAQLTAIY